MLKGIPSILSPELVAALMAMGHGDELLLADGNFPAATRGPEVIRADGHDIPSLLEAILKLFPLDGSVPTPVTLMKVPAGESLPGGATEPPVWAQYKAILESSGEKSKAIEYQDKPGFITRSGTVALILATGEPSLFANVILRKGVVVQ